ncbi:hypothetical protein COCON_G00216080 [Conger conger]|uniref:D-glucuronyl C5-epimerase n=1 Tax=Conger conger TaxID=82655 RepID=A0A9Q1CY07_CONCO|nr:hypothetical protein COCON_G00216080 [Conger conger]
MPPPRHAPAVSVNPPAEPSLRSSPPPRSYAQRLRSEPNSSPLRDVWARQTKSPLFSVALQGRLSGPANSQYVTVLMFLSPSSFTASRCSSSASSSPLVSSSPYFQIGGRRGVEERRMPFSSIGPLKESIPPVMDVALGLASPGGVRVGKWLLCGWSARVRNGEDGGSHSLCTHCQCCPSPGFAGVFTGRLQDAVRGALNTSHNLFKQAELSDWKGAVRGDGQGDGARVWNEKGSGLVDVSAVRLAARVVSGLSMSVLPCPVLSCPAYCNGGACVRAGAGVGALSQAPPPRLFVRAAAWLASAPQSPALRGSSLEEVRSEEPAPPVSRLRPPSNPSSGARPPPGKHLQPPPALLPRSPGNRHLPSTQRGAVEGLSIAVGKALFSARVSKVVFSRVHGASPPDRERSVLLIHSASTGQGAGVLLSSAHVRVTVVGIETPGWSVPAAAILTDQLRESGVFSVIGCMEGFRRETDTEEGQSLSDPAVDQTDLAPTGPPNSVAPETVETALWQSQAGAAFWPLIPARDGNQAGRGANRLWGRRPDELEPQAPWGCSGALATMSLLLDPSEWKHGVLQASSQLPLRGSCSQPQDQLTLPLNARARRTPSPPRRVSPYRTSSVFLSSPRLTVGGWEFVEWRMRGGGGVRRAASTVPLTDPACRSAFRSTFRSTERARERRAGEPSLLFPVRPPSPTPRPCLCRPRNVLPFNNQTQLRRTSSRKQPDDYVGNIRVFPDRRSRRRGGETQGEDASPRPGCMTELNLRRYLSLGVNSRAEFVPALAPGALESEMAAGLDGCFLSCVSDCDLSFGGRRSGDLKHLLARPGISGMRGIATAALRVHPAAGRLSSRPGGRVMSAVSVSGSERGKRPFPVPGTFDPNTLPPSLPPTHSLLFKERSPDTADMTPAPSLSPPPPSLPPSLFAWILNGAGIAVVCHQKFGAGASRSGPEGVEDPVEAPGSRQTLPVSSEDALPSGPGQLQDPDRDLRAVHPDHGAAVEPLLQRHGAALPAARPAARPGRRHARQPQQPQPPEPPPVAGGPKYEEIDCLINDDATIKGRREGADVYLPFGWVERYFQVYGKVVQYDGYDRFEFSHSYSKVYAQREPYHPDGVFMSFEGYNVEVRDRVKCISGVEGVPLSTQWGPQGYFYAIQIAQYGLSHYSKNLTERPPHVELYDTAEERDSRPSAWVVPKGCSLSRAHDKTRHTAVRQFSAPGFRGGLRGARRRELAPAPVPLGSAGAGMGSLIEL